jgi:GntR family transcriptional regulator
VLCVRYVTIVADVDPMGNPEFTYVQVANAIAARIAAGKFSARLPGQRNLAREYRVSYATTRHGIELLRTRGVVISRQGRGTFVTPPARPGMVAPKPSAGPPPQPGR